MAFKENKCKYNEEE
jgi:hypothetical protein